MTAQTSMSGRRAQAGAKGTPDAGLPEGAPPPRVFVASVSPEVDGGRFAVKRLVGEPLRVEAVLIADGHERVAGALQHRAAGEEGWREIPLTALGNDRFEASFSAELPGYYEYRVEGWLDRFATWRSGLERKVEAGQTVDSELLEGAELVRAAAGRAAGQDRSFLLGVADRFASHAVHEARVEAALDERLQAVMAALPDRSAAARHPRILRLDVERERAGFGAWYELFPRSAAPVPGQHGTFRDVEARLGYVAAMGFEVLYLPPIHPIGRTHRKGRNNAVAAGPGDCGSPWAIGSEEGGHDAIHPQLGDFDDFARLVARAGELGIEIALDLAWQCSPDHPYVRKHPEWFLHRPDGTIQYAENPPKKYQDIYPLDFECSAWRELWAELRRVVLFWVDKGVRIFRVDNPHTKAFAFWEWLIREVRNEHPDVVFLAEAFTRPAVMHHLAKAGFSQSYTYFTWRNTRHELTEYMTELTRGPESEFMRPNFFPNTPDILHEYLQTSGRPGFQIRLVLAATLVGSFGIYGPPFELCVGEGLPGKEEYLDSEKYEIRHWDLEQPHTLRPLITRLNRVRRENEAFRHPRRLDFVPTDNDRILAFLRTTPDGSNTILVVVSVDPYHTQSGWLDLPLERLGLAGVSSFQVDDLLGGGRFLWHGAHNYVSLDPHALPAHVFRIRRRVRTERDFDYYL